MKVLYVTMQFPSPSETFATNEVRVLSRHGIDVTVHGLRYRHPDALRLAKDRGVAEIKTTHNGVTASLRGTLAALRRPKRLVDALTWVVRRNRHNARALWRNLVLLPRAFDIFSAIERHRPDVVHMYWGHFPSLVGYQVQRHLSAVVTSMSIVAYDLEREYGGTVDVARQADVIRTHASVNTDHIVRFTGVDKERVNVIYNGVDTAWLRRICDGHEKVRHRVLTAGRLTQSKGMREVITAFAKIRARWPDASLVVVGDGVDRPTLESLCTSHQLSDAVQFLGHVSHEHVVEEMARAEVFLLLSRSIGERLPNVVKEAMACRCVCITTETPGIAELVEHEITGFVVEPRDERAVCQAVDDVFAERIDVSEMTAKAVKHIEQSFDVERTAIRYADLWQAAITLRTVGAAD